MHVSSQCVVRPTGRHAPHRQSALFVRSSACFPVRSACPLFPVRVSAHTFICTVCSRVSTARYSCCFVSLSCPLVLHALSVHALCLSCLLVSRVCLVGPSCVCPARCSGRCIPGRVSVRPAQTALPSRPPQLRVPRPCAPRVPVLCGRTPAGDGCRWSADVRTISVGRQPHPQAAPMRYPTPLCRSCRSRRGGGGGPVWSRVGARPPVRAPFCH